MKKKQVKIFVISAYKTFLLFFLLTLKPFCDYYIRCKILITAKFKSVTITLITLYITKTFKL